MRDYVIMWNTGAMPVLFILTGKVQIGKSRWLEGLIDDLAHESIDSYGVISAGVWIESDSDRANAQGFEKLGIDSVLLPGKERIPFAQRLDLAKANGSFDAQSQAGKVGLGWHISDAAIDRVNGHLGDIRKASSHSVRASEGLLVIDEVGRLELENDGGLVEAMRLLEQGPTERFLHALVVARDIFADEVASRFSGAWKGATMISPDDEGAHLILAAMERSFAPNDPICRSPTIVAPDPATDCRTH